MADILITPEEAEPVQSEVVEEQLVQEQVVASPEKNTLAVASVSFSLVGIVSLALSAMKGLNFYVVTILLSAIGIILSVIALKGNKPGEKFAIAGLILGALAIFILSFLYLRIVM